MKDRIKYQIAVWIAALILVIATGFRLSGQSKSRYILTSQGAIGFFQCEEDVITVQFTDNKLRTSETDVHCKNIDKAGPDIWWRAEALILMADDAAVTYRRFLMEKQLKEDPVIWEYFQKCLAIRSQLRLILTDYNIDLAAYKLQAQ